MSKDGRGKSPNSRKALEENRTKTAFRGEIAVENQKKAVESRHRHRTLREELLLLLESGDLQERMASALIHEAIAGNNAGSVRGAFETIRDTIGEKPKDAIELSGAGQVKFVFGSPDEDDEYSG